jgi:uncharacterized membrane protein YphA (DoxX/SURF4 family)
MLDSRLRPTFQMLRLVYGLVPIVAGLDKFTNLLTDWSNYLAPWVASALPFSPEVFMRLVGVIEIAAGVLVLSKLTRVGAYVVSAWLVGIALNLITSGRYLDVAVRDLAMAFGAFALAKMAEVRAAETAGDKAEAHTELRTSRASAAARL